MIDETFKIVVQARTNSSRFPKKIVREVDEGKTFLHLLLTRLSRLKLDIVVATTTSKGDDIIESICQESKTPVYRGSEENVLERFIECSKMYKIEKVIRVCSDNPFLDIESLARLVEQYNGEDYLSYSINGTPSILTHFGFFAELVTVDSLKKIYSSQSPKCIEHVTNCIYTNREEFNVNFIPLVIGARNIRCTLDTEADFDSLKSIYFQWYCKTESSDRNYSNLIRFIESEPSLLLRMENEIKKNRK